MHNDSFNEYSNLKIVPFPVFQAHCGERKFIYSGKPGNFHVNCSIDGSPNKCNGLVCPVWNSNRVRDIIESQSLRDINIALKLKGENGNELKI
jgi:hypothetical protein